jgi:ABC-2 type transport system permease protein
VITVARQYLALSRRSILTTVRQPTSVVPTLLFPLLFLAMSSAAFDRSTSLPGFPPVKSFMDFVITTSIIQGALFGSVVAGSAMATDIEGGFFDRLIAAPTARTSIIVGRVTAAAVIGFAQAWLYFGITIVFGLDVAGGLTAMLMVAVAAALLSAGIGSISVAFALRTGSTEAVQGSFPMLFAGLFLSSAFFPRNLMNGWFEAVATVNPLSHMIEGLRHQVIDGISLPEFGAAIAVAGSILVVGTALAGLALRARLSAGT